MPRWSGWAWASIAATATFIAITCWWLSQDRGVPFADAGSHLFTVIAYHDLLASGEFGDLWTRSGYYPPVTFIVGALATFVGGVNASAPVVGENLVYVSLLSVACYQTGRMIAGPQAGFMAVLLALGSPLLIEQFHVFMIDAPQASIVAVSVWLILASERFSRIGVAAIAGLAVGVGLNSKEQFPIFVVGLVVVVLLRGGWRNGRGLAVFAVIAFVVAVPWYAINWELLDEYAGAGLANANLPPRGKPPLMSISNLGWYFWAIMNGLLFAPLFAFAAIGVGRAAWALRARGSAAPDTRILPELLGGLSIGWLGITLTPHHDMRYTMPLIIYLAVIGTAWIVPLRRTIRVPATAALGLAVIATTLGATFGVGGEWRILLTGRPIVTDVSFGIPPPNQLTVYADHNFNVAGPRRDDRVRRFLAALRDNGVTGVAWNPTQVFPGDPLFDSQGVALLARFTGISFPEPLDPAAWDYSDPHHAFLIRQELGSNPPPCLRLPDGTGVWVILGDPTGEDPRVFCPT